MMRKFIYLLPFVLLISCKSGVNPNDEVSSTETEKEEISIENFNYDTLRGMYKGDFGGSDIRIVLNFVSEKHAAGYNIHRGLQRNISGKVTLGEGKDKGKILMELNEPGDDEFDGTFYLTFSKLNFNCEGYWKSKSKKIGKKKFVLEKLNTNPTDLDYENLSVDKFTSDNFTRIFYFVGDSISDIYFDDDGGVRYEFYPQKDEENRVEQVVVLDGSWTVDKGKVYIHWKKNAYIKEKKSTFEIVEDPEYGFYMLYGQRKLYPSYF